MIDRLDALEKLGRLHESGVLSDDEFAAEKRRILASPTTEPARGNEPASTDCIAADATDVAAPASAGRWLQKNRWPVAGLAAALAIGGLIAYAVVLDLNDAAGTPEAKVTASAERNSQGSAPPARDLTQLLQFGEPSKCGAGDELRGLVETLAARQPAAQVGAAPATIRLTGLEEPLTPRVERVAVEGARQAPVVAQVALSGGWHGLTVRELRTVTWPAGRASSIQIRFADDPERARRALNAHGFDLPSVGELRNSQDSNGRLVALGIEEVAGGSALTCLRGEPRESSQQSG